MYHGDFTPSFSRVILPAMRRGAYRLAFAIASSVFVTTASALGAQPDAPPAAPQPGRPLVGVVRDAAGAAVERVTVTVNGTSVLTDVRGGFRLVTADIDTVTIGLPGSFDFNQQSVNAVTSGQTEPVIVFKMKQPLPAATRQAGSGYEATTVAGRQVFRPKGAGNKLLVWMADDLRTVMTMLQKTELEVPLQFVNMK
jgi:hypothetical protein